MPGDFYGETNQAQKWDFILVCTMKGKAWWKDILPELELKWQLLGLPWDSIFSEGVTSEVLSVA